MRNVVLEVLDVFYRLNFVMPTDLAEVNPAFTNIDFTNNFLKKMVDAGLLLS